MIFFEEWENNRGYTLGAELEARIQDSESFELKNSSSEILSRIDDNHQANIHQEFLECMVEFVSPVCENSNEVIDKLKEEISYLSPFVKNLKAVLATSGSHSFKVEKLLHVNEKRYDDFANEYGTLLSRFHICGFHIHVALPSSDEAVKAYNLTLEYLPVFLALSANSPFYNGEETKLLSHRAKLFEQLPRAGLSGYFDSYEDMQRLYKTMHKAGSINSHKDIWWDVRISPKFKTLEIRICDACSDFERLRLLIDLFQALCLYAQTKEISKIPHQILLQNRWNAARHGLDGVFQNNSTITTIREHFLNLVKEMEKEGIFRTLGTEKSVDLLNELAYKDEPAKIQLNSYKESGDFISVEKLGVIG